MTDAHVYEWFEQALRSVRPTDELLALARALRAGGMSQTDMYELFDRYRAAHHGDADEMCYNAILDTMDVIAGWCSVNRRLE
jgi:hypothetical protein